MDGDGLVLVLAPDPAAVRAARRFVADRCSDGSAPEDLRDTAVLLVSELVTNAFSHGRSEARIRLSRTRGLLSVEVADDNSRHPGTVAEDADALDGRGLAILELLRDEWGVVDRPYGKTVWFTLSL